MDVVQQTRFSKKVLLEMFHTFVEMRTATYVDIETFYYFLERFITTECTESTEKQ
nr:hypothetical protein [Methanosarcinaceae archaeon]